MLVRDTLDAHPHQIRSVFTEVDAIPFQVVPRVIEIDAIFGSVDLDLTKLAFQDGLTEIRVNATFGSVEIALPDGVQVEQSGRGIMGSFSSEDARPASAAPWTVSDPARHCVRITGRALFGTVELSQYLVPVRSA